MARKDLGRVVTLAFVAALGVAAARTALAQAAVPWVHIRVEETARASKVNVNLPMPVVEAALKAAPDTVVTDGKFNLGHHSHNLKVADLRQMWQELKKAGDTEFVTVEEKDETVKVARRGDLVEVKVNRNGQEEVHVEVPVTLVDAFFSGEGNEVDVKAAVRELSKRRGDVVRVKDEDSTVRIWIDEKN
jgi:RNase H-fold protein (predicted Holliday junction resolvase)